MHRHHLGDRIDVEAVSDCAAAQGLRKSDGELFEERIMDLGVDIPLERALDRCWEMLAECFEPVETGIRRSILEAHWPRALAETEAA